MESGLCNTGPFIGSGKMQYGGAPEASEANRPFSRNPQLPFAEFWIICSNQFPSVVRCASLCTPVTPTCQVGNARVSRPSFTRSPSLFGALFWCMDLPFPTRLPRPSRATNGLEVGLVQQLAAVVAPPIVPPCWALHSPTAALEVNPLHLTYCPPPTV